MEIIKYKKGIKYINPKAVLYLAYGSNLYIEQMNKRCPTNVVVGKLNLPDYKLEFRRINSGYYATIGYNKGSYVPCVIYAISKKDKKTLDKYEGIGEAYNSTYINNCVIDNIKYDKVLVYLMKEITECGLPNESYLFKINKGYEYFNLDSKFLIESIEESYKKEQQNVQNKYNLCKKVLENKTVLNISGENVSRN